MADDKEFYTLNEAAAYLGIHPETVRRMIKDKRLAAELVVSDGRAQWRIQHGDLIKTTVNPPHRPPSNSN
jgi:excisionase family DNA binding protein